MVCPDKLTLDLWVASALPSDEAAGVGAHVRACASCETAQQRLQVLDSELHAALSLDDNEVAYLSGLELAATWRAAPTTPAPSWGWIALAGVVAGFVAWLVVAPTFGWALATAVQIGLATVVLNAALTLVFIVVQILFEVVRNPALGLSQPLLALLALALLIWPRQLIPRRSTRS
jgi:anti-sigma factor RsiW